MASVLLSIGSNIGDKQDNLNTAIGKIEMRIGKIISLSAFYETEPWGFESNNTFLNAAIQIETELIAEEVLDTTQLIETEMGRFQKSINGYTDRVIDIDILFYDDLILKSDRLTIPHALLHKRQFVLEPLSEISPDLTHPELNKTIGELYSECVENDKNN